jgi:16S rRNA (adenine1518-N6/adenine1519-N6)-dimethyltransferase
MGVKSTLDAHGLRPQKKWGQNFLTDARILASIAQAADVASTDTVVEIGPGLGHLTRVLAAHAKRVVAVEIDAELASKLEIEFQDVPNVQIVRGDILKFNPSDLARETNDSVDEYKVVANLPYYITSAILRHLLEAEHKPRVIVVMVQREVAQRMVARAPDMNLLAVSVQFFSQPRIIRTIAAGAFYPRPKVDSAVVRLDVFPDLPQVSAETETFFRLVRAGFGEKRKQLRNSLAQGLDISPHQSEQLLFAANIDPSRRAETLGLDEWRTLYHQWSVILGKQG